MERLRALIPALLIPLAAGCVQTLKSAQHTAYEMGHSVGESVGVLDPVPVAEFACAWSSQLKQLADPSDNYNYKPGIVGQVFFYQNDGYPAKPHGDLTISVTDDTARPPNVSPAKMQVYHFANKDLKKLRVSDERYGQSYAVFLPWPAEWRNVNRLTVVARYDQDLPDCITTMPGQPSTLTLDFSNANGASAGGVVPNHTRRILGVPNPKDVLQNQVDEANQNLYKPADQARKIDRAWAGPVPQNASPAVTNGTAAPTPQIPQAVAPANGPRLDDDTRFVIPRRSSSTP